MCSHVVPNDARTFDVSVSILRLYVWIETIVAPITQVSPHSKLMSAQWRAPSIALYQVVVHRQESIDTTIAQSSKGTPIATS